MDTMTLVIVIASVLGTVVIVGGVLFGVIRMFKKMGDDAAERARLLREGIQAGARVMGVQATGGEIIINGARSLGLMIQLEVHAPGRPPYPATMTTMISELQIPQIQPGAMLTIRIDRMNPAKMALEAAGAPPPQNMSMQPGQGYRDQPMMQPGYPQMGMPMNQFAGVPPVPAGAKIGLWLGIGGALVGVVVAVVVVLVNVGGVGLDSANEGDSVCAQAVRCCEVATAGNASQKNCKNMGKMGVPESVCQQSLQAMREMAKTQGKVCK